MQSKWYNKAMIKDWSKFQIKKSDLSIRPYDQNQKVPASIPLGARPGLGTQRRYEGPGDHRIEYVKRKWLKSDEFAASSTMAQN